MKYKALNNDELIAYVLEHPKEDGAANELLDRYDRGELEAETRTVIIQKTKRSRCCPITVIAAIIATVIISFYAFTTQSFQTCAN